MSRRRLSDDEHALWHGVIRSVLPLRKSRKTEPEPPAPSAEPRPRTKVARSTLRPAFTPPPPPAKATLPPLAPLDRKTRQRVARGTRDIDGRLDLHGLTQAEAHHALIGFLRSRQARGAKLVLVITGKGARAAEAFAERGVLRRMVPLWLGQPELRSLVVGFESAAAAHGGEGALYVSLRRPRT